MKFLKNGNWGLKFLALVLAIIVYHAMKSDTGSTNSNDRHLFHSR